MFWVKIVKNLINVLHSEISPRQIAGGVALGAIIGLTPINALHNYLVFFLILILQVNIGMALLSITIFKLIAFAIDPLANGIGYQLLVNATGLVPLWTHLYNMPIVPYTHFYNTIVLGSLIIALLLFVPIFMATTKLVTLYRGHWREKVENLKIVKLLKLTSAFNIYDWIRRSK
jgi:uncharacterized protein (TIGR03546 family)